MADMTKTAIEKIGKETEMARIIAGLDAAGIAVERVVDNGTLAFMITDGTLEGRFITIKVVLTKEANEEKGVAGFDMDEAMAEFALKTKKETERAEASAKKAAEKVAKAELKAKKTAE